MRTLFFCVLALSFLARIERCSQAADDLRPVWTIPLYSQASRPAKTEDTKLAPKNNLAQPWTPSKPIYRIGLFSNLVEVPNVRGKTWSEAKVLLDQSNLIAVKANQSARNDDVVRNQNIVPGKKVLSGTSIKLAMVAEVPDVVGKTLAQAYEILQRQNGFPMKYNNQLPKDLKVTVQEPKAGAKHSRGNDVVVASMVRVPRLRGLTVEQAKQRLTDSKLYARISTEFFLDEDRVLRQTPREGKMAPALGQVTLTPGAEVPDLIGLSPAEADRALRPSGIQGKPVYRRIATFDSLQHGRAVVEKQSIRSGNYVARGTSMRVNLVRYVYRQQVIIIPPREGRRDRNRRRGSGGLGEGGFGGNVSGGG